MKSTFILVIIIMLTCQLRGQWFDYQTLKATVLLEKEENGNVVPFGTGILMLNYKNKNTAVVITCAHLLNRSSIYVTLNADSNYIKYCKENNMNKMVGERLIWELINNKVRALIRLEKDNRKYVIKNSSLDIGAFLIEIPKIEVTDSSLIDIANPVAVGISTTKLRYDLKLGDDIYFVGFPFGIGAIGKNVEPLIRSGIISWLSNDSPNFLLDAFSFGGNSGSPIFKKGLLKWGTLTWEGIYFIGMITGHQKIPIDNILTQPDPNKLEFIKSSIEVNVGLAIGVWSDYILEIKNVAENLDIAKSFD